VDVVLCGLVAITQASSDPALWYLRGVARLDIEAVIVLVNRVATAAAACGLALAGYGLTEILTAWLVCNVVRMGASMTLSATRPLLLSGAVDRAPGVPFRQIIAITIPLGASLLLISLFQRAGVLLMDSAGTPLDVALFGTSYKFASTTSLLATSVALAHFPELVRHIDAGRPDDANRILKHEVLGVTAIFAPLCLAGAIVGPFLGEAVLGAGLGDAGRVLSVLMPGLYISSVNIATKFTLNALGRNWLDAIYAAAGLVAFCVVFYCPFNDSPCLRAAVGWAVGEAIIFVLRGRTMRQCDAALRIPTTLALTVTAALSLVASGVWILTS
jgi:O-antigen/teichoic acid export membrane protein